MCSRIGLNMGSICTIEYELSQPKCIQPNSDAISQSLLDELDPFRVSYHIRIFTITIPCMLKCNVVWCVIVYRRYIIHG